MGNEPTSNSRSQSLTSEYRQAKQREILSDQCADRAGGGPGVRRCGTTDPVKKAVPGLGPCVFIDTARFDDEGELGNAGG